MRPRTGRGDPVLRVFVASTFRDNAARRNIVMQAIYDAGMYPVVIDNAAAMPTLQECIWQVQQCDALLLVLGRRRGTVLPGQVRSITELEYEAARSARLPCLIFELDDASTRDPWPASPQEHQALLDFRHHVRTHATVTTFDDDNLAVKVMGALHRWRVANPRYGAVRAISEEAWDRFRSVRISGEAGWRPLPVDLLALHVPPRLRVDPSGRPGRLVCNRHEATKRLDRDGAVEASIEAVMATARDTDRCVGALLVGDPGTGKTTLLHALALRLVLGDALTLGLPPQTLPLFVSLADLAPDERFDSHVLDTLTRQCGDRHEALALLSTHPLLLLIDGLDDVTELRRRREILSWIDEAEERFHRIQVVVTCRYPALARLPAGCGVRLLPVHLCPLSDEDRQSLVDRWYRLIDPPGAPLHSIAPQGAAALCHELLHDVDGEQSFAAITRNPLLLTALCALHRRRGRLPETHAECLQECLRTLLEPTRIVDRPRPGLDPALLHAAVEAIAETLLAQHGTDRASEAELVELIEATRPRWSSAADAPRDAADVLKLLRDRAGVLMDLDDGRIGFIYDGLREHAAAAGLVARAKLDPSQWRTVAQGWGIAAWQGVFSLLLGWPDGSVFTPLMSEVVTRPAFGTETAWIRTCLRRATGFSPEPLLQLFTSDTDDPDRWRRQATARALLQARGIAAPSPPVTPVSRLPPHPRLDEPTRTINGYELVAIPGGSFRMGAPDDDVDGLARERPVREVEIGGFMLGRFPVSNAQYEQFLRETEHPEPLLWKRPGFERSDQPVIGVTWFDAMAYCRWAGLTLPTEAQWEYACRGGTTSRYWAGDDESALAEVGWYASNAGGRTQPLGLKPPNAFGLHDMHGNVLEWCLDHFGDYASQPTRRGDGLRARAQDDARVARGGSWQSSAPGCRASWRMRVDAAYHGNMVGFRPAITRASSGGPAAR